MKIGSKIKDLRTLRGLTQEELASRCELTKGYISLLENDLTEPSISTLEVLILALGTTFSDFFKEVEEVPIIFKEEDYYEKNEDGYRIEWLVVNSSKNEMEPIRVTLLPHSKTNLDYPHEGEEFGYVLSGEIKLVLGKSEYAVKKGESFYFTSDKNHYLVNETSDEAVIIWVSSPPNF